MVLTSDMHLKAGTAHAPILDVMMMSLTEPETQALGCIADGLAGADPRLASMLTIFSRLAAGEEMPAREKTRVRRGRPPGVRAAPGGTRAWACSRPCCCCGSLSPPQCSPSRWSSTPAATRPNRTQAVACARDLGLIP